jgi:hypothetical protein
MNGSASRRAAAPYADPYLAGVTLGLVLLAAFVFAGRGLGASGAFASVAATAVSGISPSAAQGNFFFADHLDAGAFWRDWLVIELAGVCVGGWVSGKLAGRAHIVVERGPRSTVTSRLVMAGGGGVVMGGGAVLARGCTSGQALTGGAQLSVGSWLFMSCAFATAYIAAFLFRSAWR